MRVCIYYNCRESSEEYGLSKILVLDNENIIPDRLQSLLAKENYTVLTAQDGQQGLSLFIAMPNIECVLCSMRMSGLNIIEFTKAIRALDPDIGVILITSHGDVENALEAMKAGAFDYVYEPVNGDELVFSIKDAIRKRNLLKENRRLHEEIIKKNLYFQHLHDSAQQILCHMAPKSCPLLEGLQSCAIYKSCETVGGDMYDIFQIGPYVLFYVFDVCGHGLLSAVVTMMLKSYFQNIKLIYECTGSIPKLDKYFETINREMVKYTPSNLYVTLFAGVYVPKTRLLTYLSAGHVDQYHQTAGTIKPLSSTCPVMGLFEDTEFATKSIKLSPGDRLFFFTDGILEVWKDHVLQTADYLTTMIKNNAQNSLSDTIQSIHDGILNLHDHAVLEDDLTLLGIEIR